MHCWKSQSSAAVFACPKAAATHRKHTPVGKVVQEAVDGAGGQQAAGIQVCKHSGQVGTGKGLILQACILQASSQS